MVSKKDITLSVVGFILLLVVAACTFTVFIL